MTGTRHRVPAVALIFLFAIAAPLAADAGSKPTRSGTIVSGILTTSPAWDCSFVPDCRAWIQTGCDPALTGRDPAWLTSIEDVAELADGKKQRTFEIREGEPAGAVLGGVVVQFWRDSCVEVGRWHSYDVATSQFWFRTTFKIPSGVRWMTVTGNDNVNIVWTLR